LRDERRNYLVAGSFVVAMLAALLVWIALLSDFRGATDRYYVVYERVAGLDAGTEIFFDGYPVGQIDEITPVDTEDGRRFRVDLRIEHDWPVPKDSRARVLVGLFSRPLIDIAGGSSETPIEPGGEIPGEEGADVFAEVGSVAVRIREIAEWLGPLVEKASKDAPAILANLESLTAELDRAADQLGVLLAPENVTRVARTLEGVEATAGNLSEATDELAATRARIDGLLESLSELVDGERGEVSRAARDLNHSLSAVARHIDAIAADLETSSRNLAEFTRQLREDPGLFVRGRARADEGAAP
jgi:phospholipid/cholesterol/gamma-HCH transport system substrate-binding protein